MSSEHLQDDLNAAQPVYYWTKKEDIYPSAENVYYHNTVTTFEEHTVDHLIEDQRTDEKSSLNIIKVIKDSTPNSLSAVVDDEPDENALVESVVVGQRGGIDIKLVTNDEELTPLTWLQDKNLIQGMNLAYANGQHVTVPTSESTTIPRDPIMNVAFEHEEISTEVSRGAVGEQQALLHAALEASKDNCTGTPSMNGASNALVTTPPDQFFLSPLQSDDNEHVNTLTKVPPVKQPHIHKKYRRDEHVKISQQHHHKQSPSGGDPPDERVGSNVSNSSNTSSAPSLVSYSPRKYSQSKHNPSDSRGVQQQQQQQALLLTPTNSGPTVAAATTSPAVRNGTTKSGASPNSKQKHPNNQPYNPLVHITNKPPFSFSTLIFLAIEYAPDKALPVKEIYAWMMRNFPYFKTAPTGWKNSVRHNLSLNKCFQKVEKAPNMGKGSLWRVVEQHRQGLLQTLTRSPSHQITSSIDKSGGDGVVGSNFSIKTNVTIDLQQPLNMMIDTNNNSILACNFESMSSSASSHMSSGSSSLSTSPISNSERHRTSSVNNNNNHHHHHHHSHINSSPNYHQYSPELFPHLAKVMAKLDANNNSIAIGSRFTGGCDDSEGESGGYYDRNGGLFHRLALLSNGPGNLHNAESTPDNMDDVNAATAMLQLKHGSKIFDSTSIRNGHPIITSSPSEDHTYSAGNDSEVVTTDSVATQDEPVWSTNSAIVASEPIATERSSEGFNENSNDSYFNAEYHEDDYHDQSLVVAENEVVEYENGWAIEGPDRGGGGGGGEEAAAEAEEQRKKAEGVDALLNLATGRFTGTSSITMKRRASSSNMVLDGRHIDDYGMHLTTIASDYGNAGDDNDEDDVDEEDLYSPHVHHLSPTKKSKAYYARPKTKSRAKMLR